jgi:uncharacterized protein
VVDIESVTSHPPQAVRVPWIAQGWRDVVFLHWPCAPEDVRPMLPPGTEPDLADGQAWIGVVGLHITWMRAMAVSVLGCIAELNVRTYCVDDSGRRSVVFLTLEASHRPFVLAARTLGRLPYRMATFEDAGTGPEIAYRSQRHWPGPSGIGIRLRVQPGPERHPTPFDHFVTARWRMHSRWYGRTMGLPVAHEPWPLHSARLLDFDDSGLLSELGVPAPTEIPSVLYSPAVDAKFGTPLTTPRPRRSTRSRTA